MSKLENAIDGILQDAMQRMVRETADETMRGLTYDTKDLVKAEIQKEVTRLFNDDQAIKDKLREIVFTTLNNYRVPSPEDRAKSRF